MAKINYRLGLDLGATSLGWCVYRLNDEGDPCGIVRAGVRIFSDGRDPKSLASRAADRRAARQARRRRDRLLKRRQRMMDGLVQYGLLPAEAEARKSLQDLDPFELRALGLDEALPPHHLGRALYHLCRKRGFRSSRKERAADEKETGKVKEAIRALAARISEAGCRTVGEYLAGEHAERRPIRGRRRSDGSYVLYMQRAMVEAEFDALWASQYRFHPNLLTEDARRYLRDTLLFQRKLLPVTPGRCQFEYPEFRARLADPLQQKFRMLQELNNLRLIHGRESRPLTLAERNRLYTFLERRDGATFAKLRETLGFKRNDPWRFNLETENRKGLKGDLLTSQFGADNCLGDAWSLMTTSQQRELAKLVATESDEDMLMTKLQAPPWNLSAETASAVSAASLPEDFGALSEKALAKIVPELEREVVTYDVAVQRAGYQHHSQLHTGEIFNQLPYYGEILSGHTAPAERAKNEDERRFGKISNPTVHIGLNQLRLFINALVRRYGAPSEVIVELAREFGYGPDRRRELLRMQQDNTERNARYDDQLQTLGLRSNRENRQKLQLWEELGKDDALDRYCVYSGTRLNRAMLFSDEIEIDHVLPFSQTLHDGVGNKILCTRAANRAKGNRTPFEAFGHSPAGFDWPNIEERAARLPGRKPLLFAENALEVFLDGRDFLDRHLTDTAYLSRMARVYLSYICHKDRVWVSNGKLTSLIRGKFGLNSLLSQDSMKNRNDHRHHALDAAVIGLCGRRLIQRVATAANRAEGLGENRLLSDLDLPWPSFRDDLQATLERVVASHKPEHGREAALHNDTNYGWRAPADARGNPLVGHRVPIENVSSSNLDAIPDRALRDKLSQVIAGKSTAKDVKAALEAFSRSTGIRKVIVEERLSVIPIHNRRTGEPYRYVKGDGNYCYDIFVDPQGLWTGTVVSYYRANQQTDVLPLSEDPDLKHVMRLRKGDYIFLEVEGDKRELMRVQKFSEGAIALVRPNESNVDARTRDKSDVLKYAFKSPGALGKSKASIASVDILGFVNIRR
jgi:CRISPR-associated endonuclease Csn1